jgi:hypothetical protein
MIAEQAVQAENLSRRALAVRMTCMSSVVILANQWRHDEEVETALTAHRPECRRKKQGCFVGHEPWTRNRPAPTRAGTK